MQTLMKYFQRLFLFALAVMVISSCGASYKQQHAAEKQAEIKANVAALENCDFILEVTRIIPRGFPSKASNGEYQLRLKGDVVDTRLPYMGSSHEAQYGGVDEISIVFENETVNLIKDFADAAKGEYRYQFTGGKGKDKWTVTLQIYDNGSANIGASSNGGKYMSYIANLVVPTK